MTTIGSSDVLGIILPVSKLNIGNTAKCLRVNEQLTAQGHGRAEALASALYDTRKAFHVLGNELAGLF